MTVLYLCLQAGQKPPLVYVDTRMEWKSSQPFVKQIAKKHKLELHITKSVETPQEIWKKHGHPMLGKLPAILWMRKHPEADYGFKIDCSTCCRKVKTVPGRLKAKEIGCNAMLTGLKGASDDMLRKLRSKKDGAVVYVKRDQITQINPLDGWTNTMVRRFYRQYKLPQNSIMEEGASGVGCRYCGGGQRFVNNFIRFLREHDPKDWRKLMTEYDRARIVLAIKYEVPLTIIDAAIKEVGGLDKVLNEMPHILDFVQYPPLKIDGYQKT